MLIREPGGRDLTVGEGRTRIMAALNVTPDSFYEGSRRIDPGAAAELGSSLVAAGADVLDIGGESTRPGHRPVEPAQQLRRVLPVLERLAPAVDVPISIDTTLAEVAREALAAGAHWVNDTSALRADPELAEVVASRGCPIILMHRFDPPRTDSDRLRGRSLVEHIAAQLSARVAHARRVGIAEDRILLDPGIGFGTLPQDNVALHAHLEPLQQLGRPLVFGPSRKSFLGWLTNRPVSERLFGTAASVTCLALGGVDIIRVHDVAELRDVVRVADAIRAQSLSASGESPP